MLAKVAEKSLNTLQTRKNLVGLVGYAPTTFRMSSEHSTIELSSLRFFFIDYPTLI